MSPEDIERALGRYENAPDIAPALDVLRAHSVLITGALGSIGEPLTRLLEGAGIRCYPTDLKLHGDDVRDPHAVQQLMEGTAPTLVAHLAGAKHAPEGETDPYAISRTNVMGTKNVLRSAAVVGAKVITASTCKACDPETAYGATKLVAERMTLNDNGVVARYYNVVDTVGNAFRKWEKIPENEAIPVTSGIRYLISLRETLALTVWCLAFAAGGTVGRFCIDPPPPREMERVARMLYPNREIKKIPLRRGDRRREPWKAASETGYATDIEGILLVKSPHDPLTSQQPTRKSATISVGD